jgi:hypothetical protein
MLEADHARVTLWREARGGAKAALDVARVAAAGAQPVHDGQRAARRADLFEQVIDGLDGRRHVAQRSQQVAVEQRANIGRTARVRDAFLELQQGGLVERAQRQRRVTKGNQWRPDQPAQRAWVELDAGHRDGAEVARQHRV